MFVVFSSVVGCYDECSATRRSEKEVHIMAGFDFSQVVVEDEAPIQNARTNPAENPAIPFVQASWDGAVEDAKGIWRGDTKGMNVPEKDAKKVVAQLRAAAGYIGCGLSVQLREVKDEKGKVRAGVTRVVFAAKTKRGEAGAEEDGE